MYQTVIENTDGKLAADSLGRRYFIAGSAPVVPGRKVWTDGKIIYGNIASGGSGFIYTDSILVYVDHRMNLYKINGTEVINCGTAAGGVIGGIKLNEVSFMSDSSAVLFGRCFSGINSLAVLVDGDRRSFLPRIKIGLMENENAVGAISLDYKDFSASIEQYAKGIIERYSEWGAAENYEAGTGEIKILDCFINDDEIDVVMACHVKNISGSYLKEGCQCTRTHIPCTNSRIHYNRHNKPTELLCGDYYGETRFLCGDVLSLYEDGVRIHAHCYHENCGTSDSESVTLNLFRIYHIRYDKFGKEVSQEAVFENCKVTCRRVKSGKQIFHDKDVLREGDNFVSTVDGMEIKYQYVPNDEESAEDDEEEKFPYQAHVKLDGRDWQAPEGMFIESIRKYRGKFYIVLRNGKNKQSQFNHGLCIVDDGRTITPVELMEKEKDLLQLPPSTMQLPLVTSMGKLMKQEVDVN